MVSIVKLSCDIFYLVSVPFLLRKTHFAKLDENARSRSVSGFVRKVYIIGNIGKIPFRDCKRVYCSICSQLRPSRLVLELGFCPNMDMGDGRGHFGCSANF